MHSRQCSILGVLTTTLLVGCGDGDSTAPVVTTIPEPTTLTLSTGQAADLVIGQPDFDGNNDNQGGPPDLNTLYDPWAPAVSYNGMLFIADGANNRILGFNEIPTINDAYADFVLGQTDFTSNTPGISDKQFDAALDIATDGGKLIAADTSNARVLIWNSIPTAGDTSPDVVVGQTDMDSNTQGLTNSALKSPIAVWAVNNKLFVADNENHRILIWNSIPTENGAAADLVLGQPNFTSNTPNNGGVSASTLNNPTAIWSDGTRLAIADTKNNRVLIWTSFPTEDNQPANLVLGQNSFTNIAANDVDQDGAGDGSPITANTLASPFKGIYSNGTQLFVSDNNNCRVLVWNTFPTSNFQAADVVIGQVDFTANNCGVSASSLNTPTGITQIDNQLFISDSGNNRILIYNSQ